MSAWRLMTRRLTRTVTAGAAMVAIALPAVALSAGPASAAGGPTITSVYNRYSTFTGTAIPGSQAEIWQNGQVAELYVTGSGFAHDGGPVSASTTAPGVTVLNVIEDSSTFARVWVATSPPPASQPSPGFYSFSITDDNGTASLANALGVNAASTITASSPTSVAANTNVFVTLTGTLLEANGEGGSTCNSYPYEGIALFDSSGTFVACLAETNDSSNAEVVNFDAQSLGLTAGTYYVVELGSVGTEGDGGLTSNPFPIQVTAPAITGVQPTAGLTVSATQTLTETVIITGNGFLPGATVSLINNTSVTETPVIGATTVTPTQITVVVTVPQNASFTPGVATVQVVNPGGFTIDSAPGALGIGEPGTQPSLSPSLQCNCNNDLQFGVAGSVFPSATSFPVTVGTTANFTSTVGPSFTGKVSAVNGGALEVDATPPRYATATLSSATLAAATSLPLSSTAGITSGTQLLVIDGTHTEQLKAGTPSGGSVPVPATLFAHAAGVTVEWSLPNTLYTMTINNGTYTEGASFTVEANSSSLSNELPNGFNIAPYLNGTIPVQYGGKFSFIANLPGFGFSSSSTAALVNNTTGAPAAGGTATVKALSGDQGLVTVTMPSSVPGTATLTASNDGGCTSSCQYLSDGIHFVNTDGTSGQSGDPVGMPTGEFKAAFLASTFPGSLAAGSSITAATGGPSQTFTIASIATSTNTATAAVDVVTFTTSATFNIPTNATWTAGVTSTNPELLLDLELFNGSGGAQYFGLSHNSTLGTSPFIDLFDSLTINSVVDASNSTSVEGQGAQSYVYVSFTDLAYTATGPSDFAPTSADCQDWTVSSSNTSVTFGSAVDCGASAPNVFWLEVPITVAGNATVSGNVPISIQGGIYGGATSGTSPVFGIVAGPTITSVTSLGTLTPGESGTFTVQGTDLLNATVSFNGPAPATDTDGLYTSGPCTSSATQITCLLVVGNGTAPGSYTVTVTAADNNGEATSTTSVVTVVAPSVTAITPTVVPFGYTGTFTATLNGWGTLTPTVVSTLGCYVNIYNPDGSVRYVDWTWCDLTYLSATQVTVTHGTLNPIFGVGDTAVFTIGNDSVGWADSPSVLLTSTAHTDEFNNPVVAGTTASVELSGANFNPGTTVTSGDASITINSFKINSPEDATVNVTVAAGTSQGCHTVLVGVSDSYSNTCLYVIAGPTITMVNGVKVAGAAGGAPYSNLNGSKDTLVITGTNFAIGATVSASSNIGTFGTAVASNCDVTNFDLCTTLTVPVTWISFTGASTVTGSLTVTNPPGWGAATASNEIVLTPAPTVTGTYYVPTFSTNIQYPVTGTGFQQGLKATSSNAAYSVIVANVTPTVVTLLVSTTSAATSGTSSNITFTNPDGGTVTWVLNGGPAPLPALKVSQVFGRPAHIGKSTVFQINGSNLASATVTVTHKGGGVSVTLLSNSNTSIKVRVTVKKGTKVGTALLHITNANGHANVAFSIKK